MSDPRLRELPQEGLTPHNRGPPTMRVRWLPRAWGRWLLSVALHGQEQLRPLWLPPLLTGETIVVSMASCAPRNNGNPSTTTSSRLWSTAPRGGKSRSPTRTFNVTRPPASLHTRAAALSNAKPRLPSTPETAHADRWWPKASSGRPHR